jgi:hypothetical protein
MRPLAVPAALRRLAVLSCTSFAFVGCGDGGSPSNPDAGEDGERDSGSTFDVDSASDILDYLEGKTLTMEGAAIPSHPFGFDERTNLGANTQCYQRVTLGQSGGNWAFETVHGTLNDAPNVNDTGTCDHTTSSRQLTVVSTALGFENVMSSCFDVTITFNNFGWEGRGTFSADGRALSLELYFPNQASGHRCANGAVGSATVQVNGTPFTGNAVQAFTVE